MFDLDAALDTLIGQVEVSNPRIKEPVWRDEDVDFLRRNYDKMTDGQIATKLGRTVNAIKIFRLRLGLQSAARAKGELITLNEARRLINIETHKLSGWASAGLLPTVQSGNQGMIRLIKRSALLAFCANPDNWIYHDWRKIRDPHMRRICELRAQRWGDEWWTTKQAAEYLGVLVTDVNRHVAKLKTLPGVTSAVSLSGRHENRVWKFWFVKRSDVINYRIKKKGDDFSNFTPRADAWILKARDELKMSLHGIAKTMQLSHTTIADRYKYLKGSHDQHHISGSVPAPRSD